MIQRYQAQLSIIQNDTANQAFHPSQVDIQTPALAGVITFARLKHCHQQLYIGESGFEQLQLYFVMATKEEKKHPDTGRDNTLQCLTAFKSAL
jgi:hypothetical protein